MALGGFWQGSFELSGGDLNWWTLLDFYDNNLALRIVEKTFGRVSWEGLIYEMRLVRNGREYRRTLDPDWWHNKVKTMYSYPSASDTEQGALTYNPVANSFQDAGQDFSEWETLAGDAVYSITVTNNDSTVAWGFLGAAFTTGGADDSIYVYTDVELITAGWNGEVGGKVPNTYEVRNVVLAGARQDTGFSENTDSSTIYGEMEYVVTLGGATPEGATAIRDRELTEYAWPRSRQMGGGQGDERAERRLGTTLEVSVAGYWTTLNWRYRTTSRTATASDMITTLVGASEFVTTGRIETNDLGVKADCDPIPQRLGDLCEDVILQGDIDQNRWQGGVYDGRKFIYEQSPTTEDFRIESNGALVDKGGSPIILSTFRPGVLLRDLRAPKDYVPPGGAVWDSPQAGYVEEVEWRADTNELRYRIQGQEESIAVLGAQLAAGSFVPTG